MKKETLCTLQFTTVLYRQNLCFRNVFVVKNVFAAPALLTKKKKKAGENSFFDYSEIKSAYSQES